GQGLRGHHQAPQLRQRPQEPRLAQRAQAGLDWRLGHAFAGVQGHPHGRPHGRPARHPARPEGGRGGRRAKPAADRRPRSRVGRRHRRSQDGRLMAALSAPTLGATTKAKLSGDVFGLERNDSLLHEVVKSELATRRQGTSDTKTRGRVAGGAAKPWRQKGTGRARQGTIRAPQWTGGGVVFGPHPRNYTGKVNKKARARALSIALSADAADGTLLVADAAQFDKPETQKAAGLVAEHGLTTPLVVVTGADEPALEKSFRNLHRTHVVPVGTLEVAEVVWARSLVVTKSALAALEGS